MRSFYLLDFLGYTTREVRDMSGLNMPLRTWSEAEEGVSFRSGSVVGVTVARSYKC